MSVSGIWLSQTRKQNGHYQSAKRGKSFRPFFALSKIGNFQFGSSSAMNQSKQYEDWREDSNLFDSASYGLTFDNLVNNFFPVNRLKFGYIFVDGYTGNSNNIITEKRETNDGAILGFTITDLSETDENMKYNGKTAEEYSNSTRPQHMGIALSPDGDTYSASYRESFPGSYGRFGVPSFGFVAPQLHNMKNYGRNLYTSLQLGTAVQPHQFNKIADNVLTSVNYHYSPFYRYFDIEASDLLTLSIYTNKVEPIQPVPIRIFVGTQGLGDLGTAYYKVRYFLTNDEIYPISATEWGKVPNPSDTIVRYNNGA